MNIDTGTALLIASFTTPIWLILFNRMSLSNWFKKENFKIQKSNLMEANKIKMAKLRKELGVNVKGGSPQNDKGLLEQLGGLDLDKIQGLLSLIQKDDESGHSELGGLEGMLAELVKSNPEMVKSFIDGLSSGKKQDSNMLFND